MSQYKDTNINPQNAVSLFQKLYAVLVFGLADVIAFLLYLYFLSRSKRTATILFNINTIFPGIPAHEQRQIMRKYNREMSRVAVSYLVLYMMPDKYLNSIVTFENLELLSTLYKQKKNVVVLFPHYGNWTYFSTLPLYTDYKVFATYGNAARKFFKRVRSKHGVTMVLQNKMYRKILKADDNSTNLYIILADQLPSPPYKHSVKFFNRDLYIHIGAEKILEHTKGVAIYLDITKISRYRYHFRIRQANDKTGGYTNFLQQFYAELEHNIKARPELWYRLANKRWNSSAANQDNIA